MSTKRQNQARRASVYGLGIALLCLLCSARAAAQQMATISNPSTTAIAGDTISITYTVWNPGINRTAARNVRVSLVRGASEIHHLWTYPVRELGSGQIESPTRSLRIPLEASGIFYIRACLDLPNSTCTSPGAALTSSSQINVMPPTDFLLTVNFEGDGRGTVTDAPNGVHCSGGTCTKIVRAGHFVSLKKEAGELSEFGGWRSNQFVCSGTGDCEFRMRRDTNVIARFDRTHYKVTARVSLSGGGNGSVSGGQEFEFPPPINDAGDGTTLVKAGKAIVLTANIKPASVGRPWLPRPPSRFTGWSDDCTGRGLVIKFTPTRDITCTANFTSP